MKDDAPDAGARVPRPDTRGQILEVALELFCQQGYDKTSLREVAERVGVTKAALYYYFPGKADILLALAEDAVAAVDRLLDGAARTPFDMARWEAGLAAYLDTLLSQRQLFAMIERNYTAMQHVAATVGAGLHGRMQDVLNDTSLPLPARVRIACSLGAVTSLAGTVGALDAFRDDAGDDVRREVLRAVRQLLRDDR